MTLKLARHGTTPPPKPPAYPQALAKTTIQASSGQSIRNGQGKNIGVGLQRRKAAHPSKNNHLIGSRVVYRTMKTPRRSGRRRAKRYPHRRGRLTISPRQYPGIGEDVASIEAAVDCHTIVGKVVDCRMTRAGRLSSI